MAATFNAEPLPQGFSRAQATSRPAAASAGGSAPAGGAEGASSLAAHVAAANPHSQYSLLNSAPTFTGNVTAPAFVGALTGNAATATRLATARTINGVAFDGTSDIVISAGTTNDVSAAAVVAGVVNLNLALGNLFTVSLTANVTSFTFSNLPGAGKGAILHVLFTQGATARAVTWPTNFRWRDGLPVPISPIANAQDLLRLTTHDNGATWAAEMFRIGALGYAQEVLADGPVLYARLNETSGATAANLGFGGGVVTYAGSFTLNQAAFATGGRSVLIPSGGQNGAVWNSLQNYTTALSLECMFNATAGGSKAATFLITKSFFFAPATTDFPVSLQYNQTTRVLRFSLDSGGDFTADVVLDSPALIAATDYHVVVTWTQGQPLRMYVNGAIVATSANYSGTLSSPGTSWRIGHAQEFAGGVNNSGFGGRLAEVAIYNYALPAARVAAHYAARFV